MTSRDLGAAATLVEGQSAVIVIPAPPADLCVPDDPQLASEATQSREIVIPAPPAHLQWSAHLPHLRPVDYIFTPALVRRATAQPRGRTRCRSSLGGGRPRARRTARAHAPPGDSSSGDDGPGEPGAGDRQHDDLEQAAVFA